MRELFRKYNKTLILREKIQDRLDGLTEEIAEGFAKLLVDLIQKITQCEVEYFLDEKEDETNVQHFVILFSHECNKRTKGKGKYRIDVAFVANTNINFCNIVYVKHDRLFLSTDEAFELEKELKRLIPSCIEAA